MFEGSNKSALQEKALVALRRAVQKVMREHVRLGMPIHIWENGQIVELSADELKQRYLSDTDK